MKLGMIGFGKMGTAMAERLLEQGHAISGWNRTADKVAKLDGVTPKKSPSLLARDCDVILSVLANDAATESVYFGDDGLLSAALSGKTIIEFCTMSPARAMHLATAVEAEGGAFLECPVGGTVKPARDGALVGMAAGKRAVFDAMAPLLGQMTRRLDYLGAVGNAAAMKLAINLPLMVYWGALGEAVALLGDRGISYDQAFDILTDSSGAIGPAKMRQRPIIDLLETGSSGVSNFAIDQALKDMRLMCALASEEKSPSPIITAATETASDAVVGGWQDKDISLLAAWRKRAAI